MKPVLNQTHSGRDARLELPCGGRAAVAVVTRQKQDKRDLKRVDIHFHHRNPKTTCCYIITGITLKSGQLVSESLLTLTYNRGGALRDI